MHPIIDFHCDLLSYLARDAGRTANDTEELGCALPYLKEGGVKVQVCAIFADVVPESSEIGLGQAEIFRQLPAQYPGELIHAQALADWADSANRPEITIVAALEGAATLCNEEQPLEQGIKNLDHIRAQVGQLAYISLTHHKRNRFGGGNYEPGPLTEDGKVLLEAMAERNIPLCLSHTSDVLAETALEFLDKSGAHLPVLASHSNYRSVLDEPRNLPDHLVREIIKRGGVIGLNVLRKFMDPKDAEGLYRHVAYARDLGAAEAVVFGADYFNTGDMPEAVRAEREPYYLPAHADARFYPEVLREISQRYDPAYAYAVAWQQGLDWLEKSVELI